MTPLTILPSCRGCGACCEHMGTPPGYAAGVAGNFSLMWGDDEARYRAMPAKLRNELAYYYTALDEGVIVDRVKVELPCLWYDPRSRSCRHHEWRPDICREFDPGDEGCINHRVRTGRANECGGGCGANQGKEGER
jgi:Fe-S-cluster containining protein